ncbi:MAG: RluA family pseudouridine synthase [Candidatus Cloacimonas sp.]
MKDKIRVIYSGQETLRLDKYLVDLKIQELYSRSFIEHLIEEDKILVNLTPVKKSYILKNGDEVTINLPEPEPRDLKPQNIPLNVVYEDEHLAIINKEAGMIVHPGFGNPEGTLVNAILHRFADNLSSGKESNRPGIVHRLDRGTSGLIIIAKNDLTQSRLSDMFAHHKIKKTYLAITTGVPDPLEGDIKTFLARNNKDPRLICVAKEGRYAFTHYEALKIWHYFALVKINPTTGRMHQIRVHFAYIHNPLLGDLLYNNRHYVQSMVPQNMKKKVTELLVNHLHRQALHSWQLEFEHPVSKIPINVTAPLPEDLKYTLTWLNNYFSIDTDTQNLNLLLKEEINIGKNGRT